MCPLLMDGKWFDVASFTRSGRRISQKSAKDEKAKLLEVAQDHIKRAKMERDYYNDRVEVTVESNKSGEPRIGHTHMTLPSCYTIHLMRNKLVRSTLRQHVSVACVIMEKVYKLIMLSMRLRIQAKGQILSSV